MKHTHFNHMREYANDALETDEPWQFWEVFGTKTKTWRPLKSHPNWNPKKKYRRKPKTYYAIAQEYRDHWKLSKLDLFKFIKEAEKYMDPTDPSQSIVKVTVKDDNVLSVHVIPENEL